MRKRFGLNRGQRWVLVVALGLVLMAAREWIIDRHGVPGSGWFNYAPNSEVSFPGGGWSPTSVLFLTVFLVAVWVGASLWLLTDDRPDDREG